MHPARRLSVFIIAAVLIFSGFIGVTRAQRQKPAATPKIDAAAADSPSEMRPIIEYYIADRGSLQRSFFVGNSPARRERLRKFYGDALERIQKLDFDAMSQEGKVDYILFRSHLEH